jgi:hypothetical protein
MIERERERERERRNEAIKTVHYTGHLWLTPEILATW